MKLIPVVLLLFFVCPSLAQDSVYLFSYFKKNGEDGLHLAWSRDGLQYQALKNDSSFLKPTVATDKLMRDPCIIRAPNGIFHMVWTVSWNDKGIGYASSKDLVNWTAQKFLPVMKHEDSARNTWAPEITYDPYSRQYMIYWASTVNGKFPDSTASESGYNHRMYYTLTRNFKTFTPTKLLYDGGFNVIDATILALGKSNYIMFLKDETLKPEPKKNIRIARSAGFDHGYSKAGEPITGSYWAEGATVFNVGGRWIVLFDKYRDKAYGAVVSTDLISWTDISETIKMPLGARHGTVFKISEKEFIKFLGRYK